MNNVTTDSDQGAAGAASPAGEQAAAGQGAAGAPPDVTALLGGGARYALSPVLGLYRLNIREKITRERQIAATAPASPVFSAVVSATLTAWSGVTDDLSATLEAYARGKSALALLHVQVEALEAAFNRAAANYKSAAHLAAAGDAVALGSLGVPATPRETTRSIPLGAPVHMIATAGAHAGMVTIDWDATRHATGYALQYAFDGAAPLSWLNVPGEIRRRKLVTGLPPGQHVQFRVAALRGQEQSPWSEPVGFLVR